jgi:hypothetical protein
VDATETLVDSKDPEVCADIMLVEGVTEPPSGAMDPEDDGVDRLGVLATEL